MNTERGRIVVAALNHTPAVHGVLTAARGIADMIGADVEGLHVREGNREPRMARRATDAVGVHLSERTGPVAETILDVLRGPEVVGAVMGTRALRGGPRPTGSIARRVIAGMSKPVAFVPPEAYRLSANAPKSLLVPLDGSEAASASFLDFEQRLRNDPERVVTVLLTFESNGEMPRMLDRPTRDLPAWGLSFVRSHCPGENRSFEGRWGDPGNAVIEVATETTCDLIVLSFKGNFGWGHGWVVREVLARSVVPVLLLPLTPADVAADKADTAVRSVDDHSRLALR